MAIYSGFSHVKWWFSIVCKRLPEGNINEWSLSLIMIWQARMIERHHFPTTQYGQGFLWFLLELREQAWFLLVTRGLQWWKSSTGPGASQMHALLVTSFNTSCYASEILTILIPMELSWAYFLVQWLTKRKLQAHSPIPDPHPLQEDSMALESKKSNAREAPSSLGTWLPDVSEAAAFHF